MENALEGTTGKPAHVAQNILDRSFSPEAPNQSCVTDITYIQMHEGWLYLAVVLNLYSQAVVGWSMSSRMESELVTQARLSAVWRRKPKSTVLIHSDSNNVFAVFISVNHPLMFQARNILQIMSQAF